MTLIHVDKLFPLEIAGTRVNPESRTRNTTGLQSSIKTVGIVQAPTVTPKNVVPAPGKEDREYWLLNGHRRVVAARQAGIEYIDCDVRTDLNDLECLKFVAAGNVQKAMTPLQIARLAVLLAGQGLGITAIGQVLGESKSRVDLLLRLLEASPRVQGLVESGKMSLSTFRTLSYRSQHEQDQILDECITRNDDGRITRGAVQSAKKRHDTEGKEPLVGDVQAVWHLIAAIDNALDALLDMTPFDGSEKSLLREASQRHRTKVEQLGEWI